MGHFDLVIIGSGSGNSLVTPDFEELSVAVIERGIFGGTCLNVGCIPTKMFVYAAEVADAIRSSDRYGVYSTYDGSNWPAIRDRVFGRIDPISAGGKEYRRSGSANTTLIEGSARFVGDRRLVVGAEEITADRIVLATGAHVAVPDVVLDSGVPFYTSDTIMRIDALPRSMAIIGGGFVAAEFAHVFSALGVDVHLIVRGARMLQHLDDEISDAFNLLAREQWNVHTGVEAAAIEQYADGRVGLELTDASHLEVDLLLVATGRVPNSADLDPQAGGFTINAGGRIVTDEFGRTTAEGVWAIGDVSSPYQLKHVANQEARTVAHNLAHPDDLRPFLHEYVPAAVFTHPQIAYCGLTEKQARDAGYDVTVKVQRFGDTAYGWAMEDTTSLCKVVADRETGQILGATIMGPQASTLIQPIIQAMTWQLPAHEMARGQYWIHPALTEVVENALLGLDVRH